MKNNKPRYSTRKMSSALSARAFFTQLAFSAVNRRVFLSPSLPLLTPSRSFLLHHCTVDGVECVRWLWREGERERERERERARERAISPSALMTLECFIHTHTHTHAHTEKSNAARRRCLGFHSSASSSSHFPFLAVFCLSRLVEKGAHH